MFCIQHASLLKPKYVFSLPLAFPPKRNRVDAALSLEAATLLLRIFRPFCGYLYDSKNSSCQISLARAILPSFSWSSTRFQMKGSDLSRLDLTDLVQTDCCGQPCRSDRDSSLLI